MATAAAQGDYFQRNLQLNAASVVVQADVHHDGGLPVPTYSAIEGPETIGDTVTVKLEPSDEELDQDSTFTSIAVNLQCGETKRGRGRPKKDRTDETKIDEREQNKSLNSCGKRGRQKSSDTTTLVEEPEYTPNKQNPAKCELCGKVFKSKHHKEAHHRTHTGEKPYKCDICGKAFAQSSGLGQHRKTHTGEKPYSCSMCEKSFTQLSHVQQHERRHTGDKPYECGECGALFRQASNLDQHTRLHTGEKPYKCLVCEKAFVQKSLLEGHLVTHIPPDMRPKSKKKKKPENSKQKVKKENPYECPICGQNYNLPDLLDVHVMLCMST